jgi:prefoldin subunit 5
MMAPDDIWQALLTTLQSLHQELGGVREQIGEINARLIRLETQKETTNQSRQWATTLISTVAAIIAAFSAFMSCWAQRK